MASIPLESPDKFDLYHWHRALGVVALIFVILRLVIRKSSKIPKIPDGIPRRERFAAKSAQVVLYCLMFALPALGYIASSAIPEFPGVPPINSIWFFGLELPLFPVEKNYDTTKFFIGIHEYLAYGLIAVVVVHLTGALKHRLFDKPENDVLSKML